MSPPGGVANGAASRLQFLRFLVAAGLSVPVNLGSRIVFSHWMPYEAALVASHVCGMLTAFALTRAFVFERSGVAGHVELARFAVVNLASVGVTWIIAVGLVRFVFPAIGFEREPELVGHVAGLAASSVSSYLGHRHFSFRRAGGRT
jgi:putative flippase GtrA